MPQVRVETSSCPSAGTGSGISSRLSCPSCSVTAFMPKSLSLAGNDRLSRSCDPEDLLVPTAFAVDSVEIRLPGLCGDAPVNGQVEACDVAGVRRGEEGDARGDLLGHADPAEGDGARIFGHD